MSKTRGKNISFYHFRLQEIDPSEPDKYLDYQYYKTAIDICEQYNISRASLYRVLKDPSVNTSIPFRLERVHIHNSALEYVQ